MNAYRVKEIMWGVILLMMLLVFMLSGCSSAPRRQTSEQFCDLKTETVVEKDRDGFVVSENTRERMVCNDNKIDRIAIKQAGIASNCGEYTYYINIAGKIAPQHGLACKKFDGRWEVIPN
jgi:hypothetical protein